METPSVSSAAKATSSSALRRRQRRAARPPPVPQAKTLPAAVATTTKAYFTVSDSENGVCVSGCDLVQALPGSVSSYNTAACFACITANPCYWTGTRISQFAAVYQCYRPIRFRVGYVPQVAVTEPGTVVCGTLWNSPAAPGALEQTLVTSNGGAMSPCYSSFITDVTLGANLPQNLFNCAGPLHPDTNPFVFLAYMRGANVVPGYFFVEYTYDLKNPIGGAIEYGSQMTYVPDWGEPRANRSAVVLQPIDAFAGAGLVVDVEADGTINYNGTSLAIPSGTAIVNYWNQPIVNVAPSVGSILKDVVMTNASFPPGTVLSSIPNRIQLNWASGNNTTTGIFRPGQPAAGGGAFDWDRSTASFWVDSNESISRAFVYAYDRATQTLQNIVTDVAIEAGTAALPSIVVPIVRKFISGTRSVRDDPPPVLKRTRTVMEFSDDDSSEPPAKRPRHL